jgi:transposase InsO family protein
MQIMEIWRESRGMRLTTFREVLRNQHRLDVRIDTLRTILRLTGDKPRSKPHKRRHDPEAIRGLLKRFIAGSQWMADGSKLVIRFNGKVFAFNWELVADTTTGGLLGFKVTDTEDSDAVCDAFDNAIVTAGKAPLALLTDNLPANHSKQVRQHLKQNETLDMASTAYRGESKSTIEGAFGLFKKTAPPLIINATSDREIMRQTLELCLTTYCQGRNLVARPGLGKKSAAEVYLNTEMTPEQRAEVLAELNEINSRIANRQERELKRLSPLVIETLERAFEEFKMSDPEGNFIPSIAKHGLDAVLQGIATFRAQRKAGKSVEHPERYFAGIVRNIAARNQHDAMYDHLVALRERAHDDMLRPLTEKDQALLTKHDHINHYLDAVLDLALSPTTDIDRAFWRARYIKALTTMPVSFRRIMAQNASRQVSRSFRLGEIERERFVARLAECATLSPK